MPDKFVDVFTTLKAVNYHDLAYLGFFFLIELLLFFNVLSVSYAQINGAGVGTTINRVSQTLALYQTLYIFTMLGIAIAMVGKILKIYDKLPDNMQFFPFNLVILGSIGASNGNGYSRQNGGLNKWIKFFATVVFALILAFLMFGNNSLYSFFGVPVPPIFSFALNNTFLVALANVFTGGFLVAELEEMFVASFLVPSIAVILRNYIAITTIMLFAGTLLIVYANLLAIGLLLIIFGAAILSSKFIKTDISNSWLIRHATSILICGVVFAAYHYYAYGAYNVNTNIAATLSPPFIFEVIGGAANGIAQNAIPSRLLHNYNNSSALAAMSNLGANAVYLVALVLLVHIAYMSLSLAGESVIDKVRGRHGKNKSGSRHINWAIR